MELLTFATASGTDDSQQATLCPSFSRERLFMLRARPISFRGDYMCLYHISRVSSGNYMQLLLLQLNFWFLLDCSALCYYLCAKFLCCIKKGSELT